jgi:predicted transcriptional regulator
MSATTTFAFQVDEQLMEEFLRLADSRNSDGGQLLREFMHDFVQQASDPEYDAWFREQVQIGIDDANAGCLIPSEEVEAEFAARRAETERKLTRK